ncbi:uncharacterized protein VNE69_01234 [Vairimorpha necatrix]|uniref:Uncharacterized protein n=1 Tax=Vairimorpha necatrix TaxID=6039 RepID=A0AAX4J8M8_9MICR
MDEINKIYAEIQDLGTLLTDYNVAKTNLKNCDESIKALENKLNSPTKINLENKIQELSKEYADVLNEIKKIDLFTKECYKISEIKTMFEFIFDKDVFIKKCTNFLSSLIYDLYITRDNLVKYFNPENYCIVDLTSEIYKVIKVSNDLNELFNILSNEGRQDIFDKCYNLCKMTFEDILDDVLPDELMIYYDMTHFYLIFASDQTFDLQEEQYFTSISFTNLEFLSNKRNIVNIFYDIFKTNLTQRLLENTINDNSITIANEFFKNTEYFIINVNEWKLDCVMKEVILISKSQKSNKIVETTEKKIYDLIQKVDSNFLPQYISRELFRFLLCMNIYNTIESKRVNKATKIIERGLYKLLMHDEDLFISFADIYLCIRVFPHLPIIPQLTSLRENLFSRITKQATELTKSLQDSLILLKVYFKGKHYDFCESVKKFVPKNSHLSFEITFFNLLYTNIIENILCIKYLPNDKIADISELLRYLLEMSYNIPKESICIYSRFSTLSCIFKNDLPETISDYKAGKLDISKNDLKSLIVLLHKESKTRNTFISSL